jgi:hypothetical protein
MTTEANTEPCSSPSAWQSIAICDGVSIASVRDVALYFLFVHGWSSRIFRFFLPSGRVILTRVALYLALAPVQSGSERDRDDALNLVLCFLAPARRWRKLKLFPFL